MPGKVGEATAPNAGKQPPRTLTDFQETVCNLAPDLILNGGEKEEVSNLLRALIGHGIHRRWSGKDIYNRAESDLRAWRKRLARYWSKKSDRVRLAPDLSP